MKAVALAGFLTMLALSISGIVFACYVSLVSVP